MPYMDDYPDYVQLMVCPVAKRCMQKQVKKVSQRPLRETGSGSCSKLFMTKLVMCQTGNWSKRETCMRREKRYGFTLGTGMVGKADRADRQQGTIFPDL